MAVIITPALEILFKNILWVAVLHMFLCFHFHAIAVLSNPSECSPHVSFFDLKQNFLLTVSIAH